MSRPSMDKRNRELAKRAKAEAKRARRQASDAEPMEPDTDSPGAQTDEVPTSELLRMIEDVHRQYDAGQMSEDDFERNKAELLGRIQVD